MRARKPGERPGRAECYDRESPGTQGEKGGWEDPAARRVPNWQMTQGKVGPVSQVLVFPLTRKVTSVPKAWRVSVPSSPSMVTLSPKTTWLFVLVLPISKLSSPSPPLMKTSPPNETAPGSAPPASL